MFFFITNGLTEQWLINASIPSDPTTLQFPMSFNTTNYVVAESRYGENINDATGHYTKYTYGILINPENAHTTDFIFIG